jgi:hypothetical protein
LGEKIVEQLLCLIGDEPAIPKVSRAALHRLSHDFSRRRAPARAAFMDESATPSAGEKKPARRRAKSLRSFFEQRIGGCPAIRIAATFACAGRAKASGAAIITRRARRAA